MGNDEYMRFDNWVKGGIELLNKSEEIDIYHFLYQLKKLKNQERTYIKKVLLEHLNRLEYNLKKIERHSVANVNSIINELKNNIIMENYYSIFYNVELLAERIVDLIIKKEKFHLTAKFEEIKSKFEENRFTLDSKIKLLKILYEKFGTDDIKIFVKIIELLQRMRNKFMFHIYNFDDYQFVFGPHIGMKEELLQNKIIKSVKEEIDAVLKLLEEGGIDKKIVKFYSKYFGGLIKYYDREKSDEEKYILNVEIYDNLPRNFAEISYLFILFFGKENLNLFSI